MHSYIFKEWPHFTSRKQYTLCCGLYFFRIIYLSYVFIPLNFIGFFMLFPWWFYFEYLMWLIATSVTVNPKYLKNLYMFFQQIWRGKKLIHQTFKLSNESNDHMLLHVTEPRDNSCIIKYCIRYRIQTCNCSTHVFFLLLITSKRQARHVIWAGIIMLQVTVNGTPRGQTSPTFWSATSYVPTCSLACNFPIKLCI